MTKVALRLFRLGDLADAISELTGLGATSVESLVREAESKIARRPAAEFTAVLLADREWAEGVVARAYVALAQNPHRQVLSEALVGAEAVAGLAEKEMSTEDLRDVRAASDDVRAYLTTLTQSIAELISDWYLTDKEANRAAMSSAAGETLKTVREIPTQITAIGALLGRLATATISQPEQPAVQFSGPAPEPARFRFELDFNFAPLASDRELAELVSAAVVALLEGEPIVVEVDLPTIDEDVHRIGDALLAAQIKRQLQTKASRLQHELSAFFSLQVESAWAYYLDGVSDRVRVVRSILAGQESSGSKLDVWRTSPPYASAPVRLTHEEVRAVVDSAGVDEWDHLAVGAGWRSADALPRSIIIDKVMARMLSELVRQNATEKDGWSADALILRSWHIGQG